MTHKIFCHILLILTLNSLKAQELNGFWEGNITTDPQSEMVYYDLIKTPKILRITLKKDSIVAYGEGFVGFTDSMKDTINFNELKIYGAYLAFCNSINDSLFCSYANFFKDDFAYYFSGTDIFEYTKVEMLPSILFNQLNMISLRDKKNYMKEYSALNLKSIKVQKAIVHSLLLEKTQICLVKDQQVVVLEEKDDWLKIKYYPEKDGEWTGETIQGWIRKEDVE